MKTRMGCVYRRSELTILRNERTMKLRLDIGGTGDYGLRDWYALCGTVRKLVDRDKERGATVSWARDKGDENVEIGTLGLESVHCGTNCCGVGLGYDRCTEDRTGVDRGLMGS